MPKQTQTPWLDLAVALVAQGVKALTSPRLADVAVARSLGFEDAKHEMLAFLSSDWCESLMEVILGPGTDSDRTQMGPDECIQAALDRAYGVGQVSMAYRQTPVEFVCRKGRRKPGGNINNFIGPDILDKYETLILTEQKKTAQKEVNRIVIELHSVEEGDGTVCNA